jgi:tRNA (guanine37-N1)-methyltransferase
MVLKVDVVKQALDRVISGNNTDITPHSILLTPQGTLLSQPLSQSLTTYPWLIFICGHYEGFDERIRDFVDAEISVGPYVLSGGEPAALVAIDSVVRLLPGATGHANSPVEESYSLLDEAGEPLIEYPHYTRPEEFNGKRVPDILLSGHHAEIAKWRLAQAKERTRSRLKKSPKELL